MEEGIIPVPSAQHQVMPGIPFCIRLQGQGGARGGGGAVPRFQPHVQGVLHHVDFREGTAIPKVLLGLWVGAMCGCDVWVQRACQGVPRDETGGRGV